MLTHVPSTRHILLLVLLQLPLRPAHGATTVHVLNATNASAVDVGPGHEAWNAQKQSDYALLVVWLGLGAFGFVVALHFISDLVSVRTRELSRHSDYDLRVSCYDTFELRRVLESEGATWLVVFGLCFAATTGLLLLSGLIPYGCTVDNASVIVLICLDLELMLRFGSFMMGSSLYWWLVKPVEAAESALFWVHFGFLFAEADASSRQEAMLLRGLGAMLQLPRAVRILRHDPCYRYRCITGLCKCDQAWCHRGWSLLRPLSPFDHAEAGNIPAVKSALARGFPVDGTNAVGHSLLHIACARGHQSLVGHLLRFQDESRGAGVRVGPGLTQARDSHGRTPLWLAVHYKRRGTVKLILRTLSPPARQLALAAAPLHGEFAGVTVEKKLKGSGMWEVLQEVEQIELTRRQRQDARLELAAREAKRVERERQRLFARRHNTLARLLARVAISHHRCQQKHFRRWFRLTVMLHRVTEEVRSLGRKETVSRLRHLNREALGAKMKTFDLQTLLIYETLQAAARGKARHATGTSTHVVQPIDRAKRHEVLAQSRRARVQRASSVMAEPGEEAPHRPRTLPPLRKPSQAPSAARIAP